jgi:hypothetical protein
MRPSSLTITGDIVTLPSVRHNPCEHSRISILQWILTKLGTYLVLKRIWNPIDFQGQRSKYVPSLVKINWRMLILECSQGCYAVKIWPCDLDLWPWKSIGFQILLRTKYVPSLKLFFLYLFKKCDEIHNFMHYVQILLKLMP